MHTLPNCYGCMLCSSGRTAFFHNRFGTRRCVQIYSWWYLQSVLWCVVPAATLDQHACAGSRSDRVMSKMKHHMVLCIPPNFLSTRCSCSAVGKRLYRSSCRISTTPAAGLGAAAGWATVAAGLLPPLAAAVRVGLLPLLVLVAAGAVT